MAKITLECCDGTEIYPNRCLRGLCPVYQSAQNKVDSTWPYIGTGYGNLYGNPSHITYLDRVRNNLEKSNKSK